MEITFKVGVERIRQLGSNRGQQMTTNDAGAFLALYGKKIEDLLAATLKSFVEGKLG